MKKIRLKKVLKSLGIIPNICKFCAKDLEIENYRKHSIIAFIFAILCTIVLAILTKNASQDIYSSFNYLGLMFLILPALYSYAFTVGRG